MNGIVAYSRPRGKYGFYVFTVVLNSAPGLKEQAEIRVERGNEKYSCNHCGRWATITKVIEPTKRTTQGTITFYRFDNVKPQDRMSITINDPELLFYQITTVNIKQKKVELLTTCDMKDDDYDDDDDDELENDIPDQLHDIFLINWDEYVQQQSQQNRQIRVEEDLIQKTMNAEKFEIKELLLQPATHPIALENGQRFIEGELKYVD